MLSFKGIRTLTLSTTDPQEAERFYTEVMGGKVVNRIEHPIRGGRMLRETFVQLGDFQVALADASDGPLDGFPHFTISTAYQPKEKLLAELESQGANVEGTRDHDDGQSYSCYILGPAGHRYEVWVSPSTK
jgi:catechol 2,3-dioxygenase-like lactoylglutathione lyase family enzyme